MSKSCLHCELHDVLAAHFAEALPARADGRVPILPGEALSALAQVSADIIGAAADDQQKLTAFMFLMDALRRHLDRHGMTLNSTFAVDGVFAPEERLH